MKKINQLEVASEIADNRIEELLVGNPDYPEIKTVEDLLTVVGEDYVYKEEVQDLFLEIYENCLYIIEEFSEEKNIEIEDSMLLVNELELSCRFAHRRVVEQFVNNPEYPEYKTEDDLWAGNEEVSTYKREVQKEFIKYNDYFVNLIIRFSE